MNGITTNGVAEPPKEVLISLYPGYGLGDSVQMSAVMRHVVAHRPNWRITYRADPGRERMMRGMVAHTVAYGDPYPVDHYDFEIQLTLYDKRLEAYDRPYTLTSVCLHDHFGLAWEYNYGRYLIDISDRMFEWAIDTVPRHTVAIHHQGQSMADRKDLPASAVARLGEIIRRYGRNPCLIDWRGTSPLRTANGFTATPVSAILGRDAEANAALIDQCEAFIGIDSGPAKCAAATHTPALVIWTGNNPGYYFDPADNVTHLVPNNYTGLLPLWPSPAALGFFERYYRVNYYNPRTGFVDEAITWLKKVFDR